MNRVLKTPLVLCAGLFIATAAVGTAARDSRGAPALTDTPDIKRPPSALELNRAKRNAQNLASVFSAGRATQAPALKQVGSVKDAIAVLRKGFLGGGGFDTTMFQIPNLTDTQAKLASTQLKWDKAGSQLQYAPTKVKTAPGRNEFGVARKQLAEIDKPLENERADAPRGHERIRNLAIARAEAMNMAAASFVESEGRAKALKVWDSKEGSEARYRLLGPYLAFAPAELADYMPKGYSLKLWDSLEKASQVPLLVGGKAVQY